MLNGYLTTQEVADMHEVSRNSVIKWIEKGDLAAEKIPGTAYMIKEEDAKAYVRKPKTGRPKSEKTD